MLTAMQNGPYDRRRLAAVVGVGLIHAALIAAFALGRRDLPLEAFQPPPFDILMMRLPPTPSPFGSQAGGGAPATASRVHRAFDPPVEKVEAPAPLVQAPLPALEVASRPSRSLSPAWDVGEMERGKAKAPARGMARAQVGGRGRFSSAVRRTRS